jgi:hypothetical protein
MPNVHFRVRADNRINPGINDPSTGSNRSISSDPLFKAETIIIVSASDEEPLGKNNKIIFFRNETSIQSLKY